MQRKFKRGLVIGAAGLAAAGAGGAALAATSADDGKKTEQAIIDDAAGKLNVEPSKLRDALKGAIQDQLDQAVKDGKLTQSQADALKQRMDQSGRLLPFGRPGGPGGRGGPGFGGGGPGFGHHGFGGGSTLSAAADFLGLKEADLLTQLRSGKSLADVAKDKGKSTDDLKSALKAAAKKDLDQAVNDKQLTQAQADEELTELDSRLDDVIAGTPGDRGERHGGPDHEGFGGGPPGGPPPVAPYGGAYQAPPAPDQTPS
jgi:hypothetical protein